MIIVSHEAKVPFSELGDGDVFFYDSTFYLKVVEIRGPSFVYNAVDLSCGQHRKIPPDVRVESINGRFILERN